MAWTIEITEFIVRLGPDVKTPPLHPFESAVVCVVPDGKFAYMKGLRPEKRFSFEDKSDLLEAVESLGFAPKWYRIKRKEWEVMPKEKIHHPNEAKSDADHFAFAQHALEQIKEGHYKPSNVHVSRTDVSGGGMKFSASWDLTPTNPDEPAA
jgi:hypothetical protein